MIAIDESKAVKAEGYRVSQKGESLTVTLASSFQPNGMGWKGGDEVREMYVQGIVIDGETYDVVMIMRSRQYAGRNQGPKRGQIGETVIRAPFRGSPDRR